MVEFAVEFAVNVVFPGTSLQTFLRALAPFELGMKKTSHAKT